MIGGLGEGYGRDHGAVVDDDFKRRIAYERLPTSQSFRHHVLCSGDRFANGTFMVWEFAPFRIRMTAPGKHEVQKKAGQTMSPAAVRSPLKSI